MKNLRLMLAAAFPLWAASASLAQSPNDPVPIGISGSAPVVPGPALPAAPMFNGVASPPIVGMEVLPMPATPRSWFSVGWAYNWVDSSPLAIPLLTTSDPVDQGIVDPGNTTQVLLGGSRSYNGFHGIRIGGGSWWRPDQRIGVEGSTVFSLQQSIPFAFASDGGAFSPALYRPFIDAATDAPLSFVVAEPFLAAGTFTGNLTMNFINGDSNLMINCFRDEGRSFSAVIGYRTAYVREQLIMLQTTTYLQDNVGTFLDQPLAAGSTLTIRDRIETVNRIFAGQFGFRAERNMARLSLAATVKLGFGWANQRIYYDGRTTLEPDIQTAQGGALVQRSYPERNRLDQFIFIPDIGVQARFQILPRIAATAGYNFTWLSNIARPGSYLEPTVELAQVPSLPGFINAPGTRPRFFERDDGMILHGANVGIMFTY